MDIVDYRFLSRSTLVAARMFTGDGIGRIGRGLLIANRLLPFIALLMYVRGLIWITALWAVTFPGATAALTLAFRRAEASHGVPVRSSPRHLHDHPHE